MAIPQAGSAFSGSAMAIGKKAKSSRWRQASDDAADYYDDAPSYDEPWDGDSGEEKGKSRKAGRLEQEMEERRQEGAALQAVLPSATRDLSRTAWGQAWNRHLQTFADDFRTLGKGRTEFRKGRVMDVLPSAGTLRAVVAGTRLWDVSVHVPVLHDEDWVELRKVAAGKVSDVAALLTGELPDGLMTRLGSAEGGLFPNPGELKASCTCPDHASLCVHASAVLYAFGCVLDEQPQQLFQLRGGQPVDLLAKMEEVIGGLVGDPTSTNPSGAPGSVLGAEVDLSGLFDLDLGE